MNESATVEEENLTEEEKGIFDLYPSLARVERRQENGWREIKSFVLRGQKLKDFQIKALKEHFYDYAVVYEEGKKLDFASVFGNTNPVVIEIGFGMGESTLRISSFPPRIMPKPSPVPSMEPAKQPSFRPFPS